MECWHPARPGPQCGPAGRVEERSVSLWHQCIGGGFSPCADSLPGPEPEWAGNRLISPPEKPTFGRESLRPLEEVSICRPQWHQPPFPHVQCAQQFSKYSHVPSLLLEQHEYLMKITGQRLSSQMGKWPAQVPKPITKAVLSIPASRAGRGWIGQWPSDHPSPQPAFAPEHN